MDHFEKYIIEHRKEFNLATVDKSKLWKSIEKDLNATEVKKINLRYWFRIAASILIIISSLFVIQSTATDATSQSQQTSIINQELKDIDAYYKIMVNSQLNLINENNSLSEKDKKEFLQFMDELDFEYEELKQEMYKNLDNDRVLRAIVNNYKKRIELIENFLIQLNSDQKIENDDAYIL